MKRIDPAALVPLPYPLRVGAVLAAWHMIDMPRWQAAVAATAAEEPTLCRLDEGIWALELWHTPTLGCRPAALPLWQRYTSSDSAISIADNRQDIDVWLWLADLCSAYCDLVSDGVIAAGNRLNVFVDVRHPAFLSAVIAQQEGLPLYTVVGADDGRLSQAIAGKPVPKEWACLNPYLSAGKWLPALRDVLEATCEEGEVADAIGDLLDANGYLMHPMGAAAYALALQYREQAESRHVCLVIMPFHPYTAAEQLCEGLTERRPANRNKALAMLELESGWAVPDPLQEESMANQIIDTIRQRYGD